jgi:PKD repeat protein
MKTISKLYLLLLAIIIAGNARSQCADSVIALQGGFGLVQFADYPVSTDSANYNVNITWNFGDGNTLTDTIFNPQYLSHQYSASGTYTVCATDNIAGCTACDTILVNICSGNIGFIYNVTGFGLLAFTPDAGGMQSPIVATWSFGDGDSSTSMNPTHQYAASGSYNVCLTLTDPDIMGCSNTYCRQVVVQLCNYLPRFSDLGTDSTSAEGPFVVTDPVSGCQYNWNFGDGSTGTGDTVSHAYASTGSYNVCLAVYDAANGCRDTMCQSYYAYRCNIDAYVNGSPDGLSVSYNVSTAGDSSGPYTFAWTFPGGSPSTSSAQNAEVTYPSPGTVTAQVIITTPGGCSDTLNYTTSVSYPTYSIYGSVLSGGNSSCAITYLISQDTAGHLTLLDSLVTADSIGACNGNYAFNGLPVDTYYVKSALDSADPDFSNYLPTYYGDVLHWADATAIMANTNVNANINMIAGTNPGGPGFISGWVSEGAGLAAQSGGPQGLRGVGDPLGNIQINLLTTGNAPVTYTYTNPSGQFTFKNLATGSYQVYAEVINRVPAPVIVDITQDNPVDSSLHLSVNSTSAAGINSTGSVTVKSVYPNPASTVFTLQLSSTQNINATLELVDVLGRPVQTQTLNLVNGINTAEMNIEKLPSGVYELIVQTSNGRITLPVVKAK